MLLLLLDKNNFPIVNSRSLGSLIVQASTMTVQEALNNADKADFVIGEALNNDINGKFDRIPDDLKKTKQLSKDTSDSIRDMSQANHQLNSMNSMLPDIHNRLKNLSNRQQSINGSGNSLYDKIESLKRKISNARDLTNRIRIGLTFFPNTTLELKNPESLPLQTTSTKISVYFRTSKANGFLMYLGNENRTNILRVKTVGFCIIYHYSEKFNYNIITKMDNIIIIVLEF
jgi:laminin alpha 3/5